MPANLYVRNGRVAFFGTEPAWHRLGTIVNGARNWQEAIELANLNWQVEKLQLLDPWGNPVEAWGVFRDKEMLGVVGRQYVPIQNRYAFDFVDAILEADSQAHYVSAGALGNGEKIWCLAKINGESDITGTGDKHEHYLLFATSHDGSLSAVCKLTTVRVVCQNTLTQALNESGTIARIKHTKNAEVKLEQAKKLVTNAHLSVQAIEEKLRELSKRIMTKETFVSVLRKLFGKEDDAEIAKRTENKLIEIARLYDFNDNNQFPEIRGTAYNLLNAITEYTDHYAPVRRTENRRGDTEEYIRAENSLFGTGERLKSQALEIILHETKNNPRKGDTFYSIPNISVDNILSMVDLPRS